MNRNRFLSLVLLLSYNICHASGVSLSQRNSRVSWQNASATSIPSLKEVIEEQSDASTKSGKLDSSYWLQKLDEESKKLSEETAPNAKHNRLHQLQKIREEVATALEQEFVDDIANLPNNASIVKQRLDELKQQNPSITQEQVEKERAKIAENIYKGWSEAGSGNFKIKSPGCGSRVPKAQKEHAASSQKCQATTMASAVSLAGGRRLLMSRSGAKQPPPKTPTGPRQQLTK